MKYKIGDKVTLTNGNTMTIDQIDDISKWYRMKEDPWNCYTNEMIEGLVEEECPQDFIEKYCISCGTQRCDRTKEYLDGCPYYNEYMREKQNNDMKKEMSLDKAGQITDFEYEGLAYTLPDGYQFVDENGNVINTTKIVLEKKKKEYPKTYEECEKVLRYDSHRLDNMGVTVRGYKWELIRAFQILLICRDAYWKIAGEEMGLGKPWEPDWNDTSIKYCLERDFDAINKNVSNHKGHTFAFPTEEMRDAFYENFKELINECKELL